jgi:hypothetical protein
MPFSEMILKAGAPGRWVLTRDLFWTHPVTGTVVRIPAGFETDLASIPRILRAVFSVNGAHRKAAVLHDYLYSRRGICSRAVADRTFREAMKELSVPWWKRNLMFAGVRMGGWVFYRKARKVESVESVK